jgi:hypothetical protein
MTTERVRVSRRCTLESNCVLITDEARRALSGDSLRARWPLRSLRWAGHVMEASLNAATAVRYGCPQDEAAA